MRVTGRPYAAPSRGDILPICLENVSKLIIDGSWEFRRRHGNGGVLELTDRASVV